MSMALQTTARSESRVQTSCSSLPLPFTSTTTQISSKPCNLARKCLNKSSITTCYQFVRWRYPTSFERHLVPAWWYLRICCSISCKTRANDSYICSSVKLICFFAWSMICWISKWLKWGALCNTRSHLQSRRPSSLYRTSSICSRPSRIPRFNSRSHQSPYVPGWA